MITTKIVNPNKRYMIHLFYSSQKFYRIASLNGEETKKDKAPRDTTRESPKVAGARHLSGLSLAE
jgi:hypothetical protein